MKQRDDHQEILFKALRRLDPDNELMPGTPEYKKTESMIVKWIRIYGPDQTLQMVERSINLMKDVTKPKGEIPPKSSLRNP